METKKGKINPEWIKINGVVTQGYQVASGHSKQSPYPSGTIKMQIPFFKARGLDFESLFQGTLNISISPNIFSVISPEYTFRKVSWTTLHPPEDFSFSRCEVTFEKIKYDGWIYYPHPETKIRNFQDPSIIEIIAPPIPGIKYGSQVEVAINAKEISVTRP